MSKRCSDKQCPYGLEAYGDRPEHRGLCLNCIDDDLRDLEQFHMDREIDEATPNPQYQDTPPMTDATDALEPCPFCRKSDAFVERADYSSCYVVCNDCGARGPASCNETDEDCEAEEAGMEPGENAARRFWNAAAMRNAATPEQDGLVEELREASLGLSYNGIQNGCVDCGLASSLATKAADHIQAQAAQIAELRRERDEARELLDEGAHVLRGYVREYGPTPGFDEYGLLGRIDAALTNNGGSHNG